MSHVVDLPGSTEEILSAFDALVTHRQQQAERIATKAEETARVEDAAVAARAAGYTEETIVNRLAALQLQFGAAVGGLADTVVGERGRLAELRRAIEVETRRLAMLRETTIAAEAVAIRAAERAARDKAFEADSTAEVAELDAQIARTRAEWSTEGETFASRVTEEDTARAKTRRRAEADFDYEIARQSTLADHAFAERKRDLERELAEEGERRGKDFDAREEALTERNDEIEALRTKVAGFASLMDAKVKGARSKAIEDANTEAEFEARLAEQEGEAALQLQEVRIKGLEATIERQTAELQRLQAELNEVLGRTQTMAAQAIGSARG